MNMKMTIGTMMKEIVLNMMTKVLRVLWDWILYLCGFAFVWSVLLFGVWIMDFGHPLLMLLGFIVCSSAVLAGIAIVTELYEKIVYYLKDIKRRNGS